MFTITVETTFKAGHQLRLVGGGKEPLHRHDWVVRLAVSAERLDEMGLAVDFEELKAKLEDITAPFQDGQLEKLDYFKTNNASAETLAKYIFDKIELLLPAQVELEYIEVMEAPGCRAKYSR